MTTRKVTKLLAVVAFATSPAAADPAPAKPDPWAATAVVTIATPARPTPPPTFSLTQLIERLVAPRTMPSGAPACGNVASRAPRPIDCGRGKP